MQSTDDSYEFSMSMDYDEAKKLAEETQILPWALVVSVKRED